MDIDLAPRNNLRAKISSLGSFVPPDVLRNVDLEQIVDTNDDWIVTRTGIHQRHIAKPGTGASELGAEAAKRCLKAARVEPNEVDVVIVATVTPDMLFPSTACLIQEQIGATNAWGFDLLAACSGFLYALQVGAKFIESGAHRKVLVIGADVMSSILDYTDRSTCILFGDGAGCVLLERCEGDEIGLIDFWHRVDGSGASALCMPAGGSRLPASQKTIDERLHTIRQSGQEVFKFAVRKMSEAAEVILQRNGVAPSEIDLFVPHQANSRIITATAEKLGLHEGSTVINIGQYGNTTAATIPLALCTAFEERRLKKNSSVLLASVGAGYTVGSALLRWEYGG